MSPMNVGTWYADLTAINFALGTPGKHGMNMRKTWAKTMSNRESDGAEHTARVDQLPLRYRAWPLYSALGAALVFYAGRPIDPVSGTVADVIQTPIGFTGFLMFGLGIYILGGEVLPHLAAQRSKEEYNAE